MTAEFEVGKMELMQRFLSDSKRKKDSKMFEEYQKDDDERTTLSWESQASLRRKPRLLPFKQRLTMKKKKNAEYLNPSGIFKNVKKSKPLKDEYCDHFYSQKKAENDPLFYSSPLTDRRLPKLFLDKAVNTSPILNASDKSPFMNLLQQIEECEKSAAGLSLTTANNYKMMAVDDYSPSMTSESNYDEQVEAIIWKPFRLS